MTTDLMVAARRLGRKGWIGLGIALVIVAVFPLLAGSYHVSFALSIAMYIVLAASWNLISGYAGYVSFGHVAFWGAGAYGTAVLTARAELPWPVALLGGGLTALVLALLIARPILRLSGVYFAISTLAVAEAVRVFVGYFPVTGAGGGLSLPPVLTLRDSYYLMWTLVAVAVGVTFTLRFTVFGRSIVAIRENEAAAGALGIDATRRKIQVFALSATLAGMSGSIYVLNVAFIDPGTAFDITISLTTIMMAMFGGIGTVLGPVLGAFAFQIPSELLWAQFPFIHKAALGALIVLVVLFVPKGLIPAFAALKRNYGDRRSRTANVNSAAPEQDTKEIR
jgi:branched-chain amino acid transport system permease protein